MSTHTTPPPRADQTDQAAEPALRASRFDERGIALQTVIIMVVLLAIAGTVAAVLLSRASDVTGELENQDVTATIIDSAAECLNSPMGGITGNWAAEKCTWTDAPADEGKVTRARCTLAGGKFTDNSPGTADVCVSPPT